MKKILSNSERKNKNEFVASIFSDFLSTDLSQFVLSRGCETIKSKAIQTSLVGNCCV